MKIIVTSIGTRGDIEPFLAIGELLSAKGHEIIYSFPQQFSTIIKPEATFYPLSPRLIELIESEEGKMIMGKANVFAKAKALSYLYKEGLKANKYLSNEQYEIAKKESPDLIIHNVKCVYPLLWGLKNNMPTILVSPVPYFIYYVKGHSHLGFRWNLGSFLNRFTYRLSNFGLVKMTYDAQKHLPEKIRLSKQQIRKALFDKKLIFTISPQLFQRPANWPNNVQVLGYHERQMDMNWKPNNELLNFLERHPSVVFLTFGSMINSSPEAISRVIYKVLDELKTAVIVNTAAGGLVKLEAYESTDNFHFTDQIPYEWILPKVSAVIHHGGSGTTHLSLKHGRPSLIIPHIIDQYGWNNLVHEIGGGPKGPSISKLNAKKFKALMVDLLENEIYQKNADKIGAYMRNESLETKLYDSIMQSVSEVQTK